MNLDISFYGLENDSKYYGDVSLPKDKDEVTISYDFAQKMGLKKGDTVTFTNTYTEKDYKFKVYDIYDYRAGFSAYLTRENLNKILKEDETESFGQMIPIMTSVSIIIYLVVMYILTKLVIDRNSGNMSFLKVMGYDDKEIKKLYLNATTIVVLVSLIVSAPLSYFTMDKLMKFAFMRFAGYIEIYMPYYLYALVLVLGLLVYSIVSFIINKTIQRIDLGEALKDTE